MRWKAAVLVGAAGLLLSLGAGSAQADYRCYEKIRRQEIKLSRQIHRHGPYSRQARHQREKLFRLQAQCSRAAFYGSSYGYGRGYRANRGFRSRVIVDFGRHRHTRYCRH
jgi:hypothetical protein